VRLSHRTVDQIDSPVSTAYALLELREGHRELLDLWTTAERSGRTT
jgi:hypothetical protein